MNIKIIAITLFAALFGLTAEAQSRRDIVVKRLDKFTFEIHNSSSVKARINYLFFVKGLDNPIDAQTEIEPGDKQPVGYVKTEALNLIITKVQRSPY